MTQTNPGHEQLAYFERLSEHIPGLIRQYAAAKAPHALMLSGPFGVGKVTLALLLAQALLCEQREKPCGSCPACVKVRESKHVNLLEVKLLDRQRSVKVEQARNLLSELATYPFSAGYRVVLLHLADTYTPQAQNALLKAIEEPDEATFFLLTCVNEQAVLTTIRSRCQILRLPSWGEEETKGLLMDKGLNAQEAEELAALSAGSPGRAMQIRNDQGFFAAKKLADETILSLKRPEQLPAFSRRLKDAKDKADLILEYTQQTAQRQLQMRPLTLKQQKQSLKLLSGVFKAREQQASNLSWQAIADCLLIESLEEN